MNADRVGGGGSAIDPNVATLEDNLPQLQSLWKKPVTSFLGLDVQMVLLLTSCSPHILRQGVLQAVAWRLWVTPESPERSQLVVLRVPT